MRTVCCLLFAVSVLCFLPIATVEAQLFFLSEGYAAGGWPQALSFGDLDGDSDLDLAVSNEGADTVSVLLGNGDGTFLPAVGYSVGSWPGELVFGDLNGDGTLDLAVASIGSDTVSVLLGNGDGTFSQAFSYGVGGNPRGIAIGELDGDGNLDLAVTNLSSGDVSVLLGNGDGTFQEALYFSVGDFSFSVAIGDLDGDGNLDLAVANLDSDNVSVLLGKGDGTFQETIHYEAGDAPRSVATGDLDGDGNLDLAAANNLSHDVSVLMGNGDGTFQDAVNYGVGPSPYAVAIGDLDGDGNPDLAVPNGFSYWIEGHWRDSVAVLPGNGDGSFEAAEYFATSGIYPRAVVIGDMDGDSDLDLAVVNDTSGLVSVLLNTTPTISVELECLPSSGTLPFTTLMSVTLENPCIEHSRQLAAHIDVTTGNGYFHANWRAGYVTVPPEDSYVAAWNLNIPARVLLEGDNRFDLIAEDVTPAPFNQPPYLPSGDTDMTSCTVTGIMP